MASPTEALLALLSVLAMLLLPGVAVVALLRLRGLTAVALAPVLSVSIIGVSAVVGPLLGMSWGWWVPALGTVVVLAGVFLLGRLPRRGRSPAPGAEAAPGAAAGWEPKSLFWGLAGAAVASVLISARWFLATSSLEQITQNYDTVFHLNAVHYALEAGNASSWFVGEFTRPGAAGPAPYPGAWHAMVALLVQASGLSIAAATHVMWLGCSALVWPLGVLLLTRTLVGPRPSVLAAAGALSSAFAAFPYLLLHYGTVYPNTLSNAVVPAGLALVLILLRQSRAPAVSPAQAAVLLLLYLPAQLLSQPNGVFSVLFLLTPLLLVLVGSWVRAGFGASASHGWKRSALVLGALAGGGALLLANETIRGLFAWQHPASMSFAEALWRAAMNFPSPTWWPALVLSALLLGGLYRLARHDGRGWLVATFVLTVLVYALAIGSDNDLGKALIAPWYGNPDRLAALMPLFGVPLAAVGLERLCSTVLSRRRRRAASVLPFTALLAAAALSAASPTLWQMNVRLAEVFEVPADPDPDKQLDEDELALLQQLDELTPEDAMLANNPWNGSALAPSLADRDVLFPYMTMSDLDRDRALLRSRLDDVATSEDVCAAAQRLGVGHLLDFGDDLIGAAEHNDGHRYSGIDRAAESGAFEPVAEVGHARLLKLVHCAGDPVE